MTPDPPSPLCGQEMPWVWTCEDIDTATGRLEAYCHSCRASYVIRAANERIARNKFEKRKE